MGRNGIKSVRWTYPKALSARKQSGFYSLRDGKEYSVYSGRTESDLCHRPCWLQCGEGPLGQEVEAVAVA